MDNIKKMSEPSIRRLPLYLKVVQDEQLQGKEYISCTDISNRLQLDMVQVRKDIAMTGVVGIARLGFKIVPLIDAIRKVLSWDKRNSAVLVGAGNLGEALIKYKHFAECGFEIVKAFDVNKEKIGKVVADIGVLDFEQIAQWLVGNPVDFAIITVPADNAQKAADVLVANGVKGIWNFAPAVIRVPNDVFVEHVRLSTSVAVLTKRVNDAREKVTDKKKIEVEICMGSSCYARGNKSALELVQKYIEEKDLHDLVELKGALCKNQCKRGPIITLNGKEYSQIDAIAFLDEFKECVKRNLK